MDNNNLTLDDVRFLVATFPKTSKGIAMFNLYQEENKDFLTAVGTESKAPVNSKLISDNAGIADIKGIISVYDLKKKIARFELKKVTPGEPWFEEDENSLTQFKQLLKKKLDRPHRPIFVIYSSSFEILENLSSQATAKE